jgi:hypothetical protein
MGFFANIEILVYNEEAIIVICFILFLSFAYRTMGLSFASELDDRSTKIREELAKSAVNWSSSEKNIVFSWGLVIFAAHQIGAFFRWSNVRVHFICHYLELNAAQITALGVTQHLNYLLMQETSFRTSAQTHYAEIFFESFTADGSKVAFLTNHSDKLLKNSIATLKKIAASQTNARDFSLANKIVAVESILAKI